MTPSSSTQYITAQTGYDGLSQVVVNRDSNLKSGNIKSGTSIFGILGSYAGSGWQVLQSSVTSTLQSFTSSLPSSVTLLHGMILICTSISSSLASTNNPYTSFYAKGDFTLSESAVTYFPMVYVTTRDTPYYTTFSNYGCNMRIQNGYWYFSPYGGGTVNGKYLGLSGQTYQFIAFY